MHILILWNPWSSGDFVFLKDLLEVNEDAALKLFWIYKLYIWSDLESGIQFFSICSSSAFKTLESLQNSAIWIALALYRHTPLSKLKQLSGLVSLNERASSQMKKYFSRIQAYGSKHVVYNYTFALKAACTNGYSSWNQFQLDVPNWGQYSSYAYPFTDTPP
jgi:hypothetical protein